MQKNRNHVNSDTPLRWIFKTAKAAKSGVLALTLINGSQSLVSVWFALGLRSVIDAATSGNQADFLQTAFQLAGMILLLLLLSAAGRRMEEYVRSEAENQLKEHIYQIILTRSYPSLTPYHTGELQNRMTSDTVVIADGVTSIFSGAAAMVVKLIGAATILLMLDSHFALVFLIGGGLLLLVTIGFRKMMKRLHKRVQEADGQVRSYLQETVENLLVLKSFGGEDTAEKKSQEYMARHRKERLARNAFSNFCNLGFGAVMQGGYLFGLVWCGFGILHGTITYGTLTAVLSLVGQIQTPIANMTGYLPKFYAMLASAERLMELEALPEDRKGKQLSLMQRNRLYERMDSLNLERITFSYPGAEEAVLREASLSVAKGDFVAVTGESGIGKSTLLKLLLVVYEPEQGSMNFLCRDGSSYLLEPATRPMFAYVPQGNFLMSGSIREAITFGKEERDSEVDRVTSACQIACADRFIQSLSQSYETILGEKGAGLSEGQLQRLAIARAIYSDAPILLLDEATSALDEQTEKKLLTNLRELTDKTVLIVTHRPAALEVCDCIIKVENKQFRMEKKGCLPI